MNANHTPGPWCLGMREGHNGCVIYDRSGKDQFNDKSIAQVYGLYSNQSVDGQKEGEALANARLIAAAPDLLYIVERILGAHDTKNNGAFMGEAVLCHHYAETARAAIAKARGEA